MTVASGSGEVVIPQIVGVPLRILTYLVIEGPPGTRRGKIEITDETNGGQSIFKDPKPGNPDVDLDFYTFEMRIPMNGDYKLKITDAQDDGAYKIYTITEERPRSV